jgi:hypothetical protein
MPVSSLKVTPEGAQRPPLPVIGRRPAALALVTAFAVAIVVVFAALDHGYEWLLRSDAQHFFLVATDPFGTGSVFEGAGPGVGSAYRYGRILYPLMAWGLALGRAEWVPYSLTLVYLGGVWLLAAMACQWCELADKPSERGLWVFLLPSIPMTVPLLVPEMLIAGLTLLVYRLVLADRTRAAQMTASLLLLARETMALAILPLIARDLKRRRYLAALGWTAAGVPVLLWWGWVRYRIGLWPFLDPTVTYSRPLDVPFRGFLAALWGPDADMMLRIAAAVGWLTLALAAWLHVFRPSFPLTAGAVASASLVVFFGPGQARLPGEAFRLLLPSQVLVAVSLLCWRARRAQ